MKDIRKQLRISYNTALVNTGEEVFSMQAPDDIEGNFIIYKVGNIAPVEMKTGTTVTVDVEVTVTTEGEKYNDGDAADDIAGKVYAEILPETGLSSLIIDPAFQLVQTTLVNDTTNDWKLNNQTIAIDRVITFRHTIFIR